jgi:hypothetical protein
LNARTSSRATYLRRRERWRACPGSRLTLGLHRRTASVSARCCFGRAACTRRAAEPLLERRSERERRPYSVHACAPDRVSGGRSRSRPPVLGMESSGSLSRHGRLRRDPGGRPTPTACAWESTSVDQAPATPPPCPNGGPCAGTPRAARSHWPRPHPRSNSDTIASCAEQPHRARESGRVGSYPEGAEPCHGELRHPNCGA